MEYVYHGSKNIGLKKIVPSISTHQKKWVYATKSKMISTIFISNGGSDLYYYLGGLGTKDCPLVLVERKAGMFNKIFNLSGSLYALDNKNFIEGQTRWSVEVISPSEENIIREEYIDCVLKKLEEYANNGELMLYRYPNRPNYIPIDNSDLIPKVIKWCSNGFDINNFFEIYPELKADFYKQIK